jgi:hypothetical protein
VNRSFTRKIVYMLCMAVLLIPLFLLGHPETSGPGGVRESAGGKLAQLRTEHSLSPARLGDIDPASETIKLATLGMRGVAAQLLWNNAIEFQKKEDWTSLSAALEQIAKLEPHFVNVWRFQGWNLSYNVSVEWDDYRQRYYWVLRGVKFLREGMKYNENVPILPWDEGWVIGHKMGTADEKKQYRVLFRKDDEFNFGVREVERDNWLVGKQAFLRAQEIVDNREVPIRGTSPVIFHSGPAKWQTNYAAHLEIDGGLDGKAVFGERARLAWDRAVSEWDEFAKRDIPSSLGIPIRIGDYERYQEELETQTKQLEELEPGLKDRLVAEKRKTLTEEEKTALEVEAKDRTPEQAVAAAQAEGKLRVSPNEFADAADSKYKAKAQELQKEVEKLAGLVRVINSSRDTIQFKYWYLRCEAERTKDCLEARELMYKGNQAYLIDTDLESARKFYEQSFEKWRLVFDKYPLLMTDRVIQDDLAGPDYLPGAIRYYEQVLKKLDEKFPEGDDFILRKFLNEANPEPPIGN